MGECRRDQKKFATFLLLIVVVETCVIFSVMHFEHQQAERLAEIKREERRRFKEREKLKRYGVSPLLRLKKKENRKPTNLIKIDKDEILPVPGNDKTYDLREHKRHNKLLWKKKISTENSKGAINFKHEIRSSSDQVKWSKDSNEIYGYDQYDNKDENVDLNSDIAKPSKSIILQAVKAQRYVHRDHSL